jgi:ribosomal protein S18 acetylase RimI-like enzyme
MDAAAARAGERVLRTGRHHSRAAGEGARALPPSERRSVRWRDAARFAAGGSAPPRRLRVDDLVGAGERSRRPALRSASGAETLRDVDIPGLALRDLELRDVPALATFAPESWRMALDAVLLQHVSRSYFVARVATDENGIAAVAQGIVTGTAGWLGNVIVRPEARRRGFGRRMTLDMVDVLRARGCSTLLLVATEMGEPVYRKIGFRRTGEYVFLRMPRVPLRPTSSIRRLGPSDLTGVLDLDAQATGETRDGLLGPHLGAGWGHVDPCGVLDAFFLPSFGAGLVIARAPAAGCALLEFKHALYSQDTVVPSENSAAFQFLVNHGAKETLRAPRMALGKEASWNPECIFARGTGYCG